MNFTNVCERVSGSKGPAGPFICIYIKKVGKGTTLYTVVALNKLKYRNNACWLFYINTEQTEVFMVKKHPPCVIPIRY